MPKIPKNLAQVIRFALVSGVSLGIDAAGYTLLSSQLDISSSWAKRLSFICVAIWGYFAHKHFTFHDKSPNGNEPYKFGLLYITGWGINSIVHDMNATQGNVLSPAFIIATFAWACWNFIGQKFFVFRNADKQPTR